MTSGGQIRPISVGRFPPIREVLGFTERRKVVRALPNLDQCAATCGLLPDLC